MPAGKGEVVYKFSADEARAVDAYRNLVRQQNKLGDSFQKTSREAKTQGAMLQGAGKDVARYFAGFASAAVIGGALKTGITKSVESAFAELKGRRAFEKEMTPLLGLGENVRHISTVKDEVLAQAAAWGRTTSEVADFNYQLQSTAATLPADELRALRQASMELSEVTGAELPISLTVLNKAWQNYGDTLDSVQTLENKVLFTQDQAAVSFEELGTYMPQLLASAKALGVDIDDVFASIIATTPKLGTVQTAMTGLRTLYISIAEAQKKGFRIQGNYIDQLRQIDALAKSGPAGKRKMLELFGREGIAAAGAAAESADVIEEKREELKAKTGNVAAEKIEARLMDPAFYYSTMMDITEQTQKNIELKGSPIKALAEAEMQAGQAALGYKATLPSPLRWLSKPLGWAETVVPKYAGAMAKHSWARFLPGMETLQPTLEALAPGRTLGATLLASEAAKGGRPGIAANLMSSILLGQTGTLPTPQKPQPTQPAAPAPLTMAEMMGSLPPEAQQSMRANAPYFYGAGSQAFGPPPGDIGAKLDEVNRNLAEINAKTRAGASYTSTRNINTE